MRTPASFSFRQRVRVVEGSVFDAAAVRETISPPGGPVDVVLSALGARSLKKGDVLERGVPLMVAAMQQAGVRRIIALGLAGALASSLDQQPAWRRWFVQKIVPNALLKNAVASQVSQWKTFSTSELDFTMVMPPMFANGPGRGVAKLRVDGEALPPRGARIFARGCGGLHDAADWQCAVGGKGRVYLVVSWNQGGVGAVCYDDVLSTSHLKKSCFRRQRHDLEIVDVVCCRAAIDPSLRDCPTGRRRVRGFKVKYDVHLIKAHTAAKPAEGKALVYLVQDDLNFTNTPDLTTRLGVDGQWSGATRGRSYLFAYIDPGEH